MNGFDKRSISSSKTLGDRLREVREQSGASVKQVADDLKIKQSYVEALEKSDYTQLPSRVFVKNYVRNYAKYLRVSTETANQMLEEEFAVYENGPEIPTIDRHHTKRPLKLVHFVVAGAILMLVLLITAYFTTEIANIAQPPPLEIASIPDQLNVDERFVTISGTTVVEASVTINEQPVDVDIDGSFSQVMGLQEGVNVFKIVAKTRRSNEQIEYKQVIVESIDTSTTTEQE